MTVVLGTLLLNEIEHLEKLYEQHKDWPDLAAWVFVEFCDRVYFNTNKDMVSKEGLSIDGTTEFLEKISREDKRVKHIKMGVLDSDDPAQGKCRPRTEYLRISDTYRPSAVVVLDADEFYRKQDQEWINSIVSEMPYYDAFLTPHRDIWKPPSINELFKYEAVGGYWAIPHTRIWRWYSGLEYKRNHNFPEKFGRFLNENQKQLSGIHRIHLGFASTLKNRQAKHRYYENRGEIIGKRAWYTHCREAWEVWQPGDVLPHGGKVIPYRGFIPEVFKEEI